MNARQRSGKTRIERKKEKTRQRIIAAAVALFQEHGFDATTMEQIAEDADVAKGTLYNYFPAKELIISEYVQRSFKQRNPDRLLHLSDLPDTRSRLTAVLGELMVGVQAQKEIFEKFLAFRVQRVVSLQPDPEDASKSGIDQIAAEIIRLGQTSGELRTDLPVDMLIDLFEFVFVEVAKRFYTEPHAFHAPEAIEQGVSLFMSGVSRQS